jgi:predicted acylesterase/phospholipase RssA
MSDALVLAGAVVQGAFTAGALSVLSEPETKARHRIDVTRILGASSGALNGVYHAAAIRDGAEEFAGQRLAQLWLDDATIRGALDFSLHDLVSGLGVSSSEKVLRLLREQIRPGSGRQPIQLRVIVTNATGETIDVAGSPATTFEHIVDAADADFDTAESLERVFTAVAASAALPGVYAPVPIEIEGRTVQGFDGGIVDDAPLGHALDGAPEIARVFVCAPFPRVRTEPANLHGIALAGHIFDLLVQERLIRDLQRVADANRVLEQLPSLVPSAEERGRLIEALGWVGRRVVQVVEIRPDADLPGHAFAGFTSLELRQQYVQAGVDSARRALESLAPVH